MLNIVVCVSGGGTNLQAIIDGISNETIKNTKQLDENTEQLLVKAITEFKKEFK